MAIQTSRCWKIVSQGSLDGLVLSENTQYLQVKDDEVLVELHAASINYRDLVLVKGMPGLDIEPDIIAGSDGAGIVQKVGKSVTKFKVGDKVCTHLVPHIEPNSLPRFEQINTGLGQKANGTIAEAGVFHETGLVKMPSSLSFTEAATLSCSALTAWNGLFGLDGRGLKRGDVLLTQGTGGVSIAAIQFATAVGAIVIATTSSEEKAEQLRKLGVKHIINYKTDQNWGETARSLTSDSIGVDHVLDVAGEKTFGQSIKALRTDGLLSATGLLGGFGVESPVTILDAMWNVCVIRGVLLGSKAQFESMINFIDQHKIKPELDPEIFPLDNVKEAYEKLEAQTHFSKIAIKIR